MKSRYIFFSLLLNFLLRLTIYSQPYEKVTEIRKWLVTENSNLRVNGSTNINTFSCQIPAYNNIDTLLIYRFKNSNTLVLKGCISLSVQSFDCKNLIMTHDLRKTLKAEQYPQLHIYFLSLDKLPDLNSHPESISGLVDIEIAGVKRRFEVKYLIREDSPKSVDLLGSRDINFSDFHLIPPRKLGGMIKTNDKLSVDFHLWIIITN